MPRPRHRPRGGDEGDPRAPAGLAAPLALRARGAGAGAARASVDRPGVRPRDRSGRLPVLHDEARARRLPRPGPRRAPGGRRRGGAALRPKAAALALRAGVPRGRVHPPARRDPSRSEAAQRDARRARRGLPARLGPREDPRRGGGGRRHPRDRRRVRRVAHRRGHGARDPGVHVARAAAGRGRSARPLVRRVRARSAALRAPRVDPAPRFRRPARQAPLHAARGWAQAVGAPERRIPPALDALCHAATRLAPHERLPSAAALGEAVQAFLDA